MNIQETVGMCIRLNKTVTIYMCPSTTTYKNRRENKVTILQVMYNFIHMTSLFSFLFLHIIVPGHM